MGAIAPRFLPVHTYQGPWHGVDEQGHAHEGQVTQEARSMASAAQLATRRIQAAPRIGVLVQLTLTLERVR